MNQQTTSAGEDVEKEEPFCTVGGMQVGAATVESSMEIQKNRSTPIVIAALFTITKMWKQPKCPLVGEQIKHLWDIYTMEFYLAVKKEKILPFATVSVDLENILLSEISQSEKDKYQMISLICGNLMNKLS